MKAKFVDLAFWKAFQNAVASGDPLKTADYCYFDSDEDREFFIRNYIDDFDESAVNAIANAKTLDLKKMIRAAEYTELSPFAALILPRNIMEVFTLKVNYIHANDEENDDDEEIIEDYTDENDEDEYSFDNEFNEDLSFEGDEVVDHIRVFVFASFDDGIKYMGSYDLD